MADLVIHAGDLVAASVLEELRGMGPVEAVHGNMDEAALRAELPAERVVEVGGVRIGLVHDAGAAQRREARLAARFPGCHVVVYGHTHLPQLARHGGVLVLNPGSPTERRRAPAHTMAELVIDSGQIRAELVTLST
jgi:hypothetical protein